MDSSRHKSLPSNMRDYCPISSIQQGQSLTSIIDYLQDHRQATSQWLSGTENVSQLVLPADFKVQMNHLEDSVKIK